jgi:hypothetical protein
MMTVRETSLIMDVLSDQIHCEPTTLGATEQFMRNTFLLCTFGAIIGSLEDTG